MRKIGERTDRSQLQCARVERYRCDATPGCVRARANDLVCRSSRIGDGVLELVEVAVDERRCQPVAGARPFHDLAVLGHAVTRTIEPTAQQTNLALELIRRRRGDPVTPQAFDQGAAACYISASEQEFGEQNPLTHRSEINRLSVAGGARAGEHPHLELSGRQGLHSFNSAPVCAATPLYGRSRDGRASVSGCRSIGRAPNGTTG